MVRKYGDPAGPRLYSLQIRSNAGCQLVCYPTWKMRRVRIFPPSTRGEVCATICFYRLYELKERSWMTEHLNLTSREFCHDPIPRSTPG